MLITKVIPGTWNVIRDSDHWGGHHVDIDGLLKET